jgi:hypothetical protein
MQPLLPSKGNKYYIFCEREREEERERKKGRERGLGERKRGRERECVCVAFFIQHEPYCHLWPLRLYYISPHYLMNYTIFEKKKKNYST